MALKNKLFYEEEGIRYLCQKAYAEYRGCNKKTIYRYIKDKKLTKGLIEREGQLFIDVTKADKQLAQLDPSNKLRGDTQKLTKGKKIQAELEPEVIPPDTDSYAFHRAQKEAYASKLEKIKYEKQVGSLVSRKQVELEAESLGRRTRDAVLNVPPRIAALLAATTERTKCELIVESELRKALEEITLQDQVILEAIKNKEIADVKFTSESEEL
jgi:hypothetical protein